MKKVSRLAVFSLLLILPLLAFGYYWNKNTSVLTFIYTSDGHGHILPSGHYRGDTARKIGGLSALGGFLQTLKEPHVLVDSGDFFQGTPEGVIAGGSVVVELMNMLGYDAAGIGNHDFDFGKDALAKLSGDADFAFLGSNMKENHTGSVPAFLKALHLIEKNGIVIGLTGVITDNMTEICIPENIDGLTFAEPSRNLSALIADIRKKGAGIVAVLSHQGVEKDIIMARETGGIDIIFSGHSHGILETPVKIGRTLIVQSGWYFENAGFLKVYYDRRTGRIAAYKNIVERLFTDKYRAFEPVETKIDEIKSGDFAAMYEVIGECSVFLPSKHEKSYDKHGELALGNFQTDIIRKAAEADFAFQNTGAIRSGLASGKLMIRDIWELSPFGNSLVKMTLKGSQIKELLEHSFSGDYSGLQVSGLSVIFNDTLPQGKRVLNIILRDESGQKYELALDKEYTIVTNSFLAKGGDGYTVFNDGVDIEETGIIIRDLLIEYIREHSPVSARREGRLINVSLR